MSTTPRTAAELAEWKRSLDAAFVVAVFCTLTAGHTGGWHIEHGSDGREILKCRASDPPVR